MHRKIALVAVIAVSCGGSGGGGGGGGGSGGGGSGGGPGCGNGVLDGQEECDDGNVDDFDECDNECFIDPSEPGPFGFNRRSFDNWHDAVRDRAVPTDILYPADVADGVALPVVVFSHGLGGKRDSYDYLTEHWASHGYVVLVPEHIGSNEVTEPVTDGETIARAEDVNFVLDQAELLNEEPAGEFTNLMDLSAVAVAGHSYGSCTAFAAGGAVIPATDQNGHTPDTHDDPRVGAVVGISPQGPYDADHDRHFFNEQSYDGLDLPVMSITGSEDTTTGGVDPIWRMRAYELMPAGDKHLVYIEGATHLWFSDTPACSSLVLPEREETCEKTKLYTRAMSTALLDVHVLGRVAAAKYLTTSYVAVLSGTDVQLTSK